MIISNIKILEVEGNLSEPFSNARTQWTSRRGLWLGLRDSEGRWGQGEACPLPGYSTDTLDRAREALGSLSARGLGELELEADIVPQVERAVALIPRNVPSARFALETALLDLAAQAMNAPLHQLLGARATPVRYAGVVSAEGGLEALQDAQRLVARGIRTIKVKIRSGPSFERHMAFLRSLRQEVGCAVAIRVDANRCLEEHMVSQRLRELASVAPEFVEEPVAPESLAAMGRCPVALGLDESLQHGDSARTITWWVGCGTYGFVVLKPMVLGGILRCLSLGRTAQTYGGRVIVSHTLEGPIGWSACAALAVTLAASDDVAAGLGPHPGLSAWPEVSLPGLQDNMIVPCPTPGLGLRMLRDP